MSRALAAAEACIARLGTKHDWASPSGEPVPHGPIQPWVELGQLVPQLAKEAREVVADLEKFSAAFGSWKMGNISLAELEAAIDALFEARGFLRSGPAAAGDAT